MAKRIVLCFDGTWNTPDEGDADKISSETNVVRFHASVPKGIASDGVEQLAYYYPGVGTNWFDRFTGGGLGVGVSRTMMQGYKDLGETYETGDRIFLLGFSRGYLRPVGRTSDGGEIVHESVRARRLADPGYQPANPGLPPL